ncbi:MAG: Crp/Fnr family transcriptional regulator [Saprospiraceae bacterium]
MKEITVKKGQILQRTGDLNSKAYMVKSGLLRSYSIDEKGKEHIFMFGPEGWIISDYLPVEQPCDLFIDVLEDSTIIVREKKLEELLKAETEKLFKRISVLQKRVIMLMSSSAIERYEHFIETYPQIVQRVPQRMIASYLGITPEALSKVKGERIGKR